MSTEKMKKSKRFPLLINHSVIVSWFVTTTVITGLLAIFAPADTEQIQDTQIFIIVVLVPVIGFVMGFVVKWLWAKQSGTDAQLMRVRAQFWASLGFTIAFVITLLAILLTLIMFEQNDQLPASLPDPITMLISFVILLIGMGIGINTYRRILRNFAE